MSLRRESAEIGEKHHNGPPAYMEPRSLGEHAKGRQLSVDPEDVAMVAADQNQLKRELKGRHMQMIAMQVRPLKSKPPCADNSAAVVVPSAPGCSLALVRLSRAADLHPSLLASSSLAFRFTS